MDNKGMEESNVVVERVFVPVEAPKVDAMMIVRSAVFVVALINAIAALLGFNLNLNVDQELWYNVSSALLLCGSGLYSAWKNNDFTRKARIKAEVAKQVENKI